MATLTAPIPVLMTPEQRREVEEIARAEGISLALVVRELIDKGLPARRRLSLKRLGLLP